MDDQEIFDHDRGELEELLTRGLRDRVEKLRGALGLVVTQSPTLAMAQALAREALKRDDEASL